MAAPSNQTCLTAIAIASIPFSVVANTTEAGNSPSAPDDECGSGSSFHSVWYRWTCPSGRTRIVLTVDTEGIGEPVVTAFSGTCGALVSNFDCNSGDGEYVMDVEEGVTYYFMLTSEIDEGIAAFGFSVTYPMPSGGLCVDLLCGASPITGLAPVCGSDRIIITGSGFPDDEPTVTVEVDGDPITPLTVISFTETEIVIGLPSTLEAGEYAVTVNGSDPFTDDLSCEGVVTDITHECGTNNLVLTGEGFSTDDPDVVVTFNGVTVEDIVIVSATETEIVVALPTAFMDGTYCAIVDDTEPARCEDLTCAGPPVPGIIQDRPIRRLRQAPHLSDENVRMVYNNLELDCQVGIGNVVAPGVNPIIFLSWSDDSGRTWSNEYPMSMGILGAYLVRVFWYNLGQSRDRIFRFVTNEPVDVVFVDAYLAITKGTS